MSPERNVTYVSGMDIQKHGGLGGTRTPDALLRTEALYPLSYEAGFLILAGLGVRGLGPMRKPAHSNANLGSVGSRGCFGRRWDRGRLGA